LSGRGGRKEIGEEIRGVADDRETGSHLHAADVDLAAAVGFL